MQKEGIVKQKNVLGILRSKYLVLLDNSLLIMKIVGDARKFEKGSIIQNTETGCNMQLSKLIWLNEITSFGSSENQIQEELRFSISVPNRSFSFEVKNSTEREEWLAKIQEYVLQNQTLRV